LQNGAAQKRLKHYLNKQLFVVLYNCVSLLYLY